MQNKTTKVYSTQIQPKLPVDMERIIKINDAVYSFSEVMAHIDLHKYFVEKEHGTGRPRYDREKLLKIVLFAFMEFGCCELHNMEKYMKFTMYEKESKDSKYRDNPYRACHFDIDHEGYMICPNGKRFHFLRSAPVKGNQFGITEEYYRCEDCTDCSHREKCHKSKENRVVRINEGLTKFHSEVLNNPNCVHGALLRMNRSIQSEGTFGAIKWNKGYKRLRRRGIEGVILELGLISCGFNLYKYHLKKIKMQKAA